MENEYSDDFPSIEKPSFPTLIDSTIIAAYKSCQLKGFYEFFCNITKKGTNPDLNAGSAYAIGHEVFRKLYYGKNYDIETAKQIALKSLIKAYGDYDPPDDNPKKWNRVATAFLAYYDDFPPDTDFIRPATINDQPIVEFSFAEPLDIKHPETGDPILYGGKFDSIMQMHGPLFVFDDKTTKQMGPTWAEQWRLRSQFSGYVWGAERAGYDIAGVIVRGAAIQVTQIKFAQAITYRSAWEIERWYEMLIHTIEDMIRDWNRGYFKPDLDSACTSYGGCQFRILCESPNPEKWVPVHYEKRTWSPIDIESL